MKLSESPPTASCACFPALLRRRQNAATAPGALHVDPSAAAAPGEGEPSVASPKTPQQRTRSCREGAAPIDAGAESNRSAPYGGSERFFGTGSAAAAAAGPAAGAHATARSGKAAFSFLCRGSGQLLQLDMHVAAIRMTGMHDRLCKQLSLCILLVALPLSIHLCENAQAVPKEM